MKITLLKNKVAKSCALIKAKARLLCYGAVCISGALLCTPAFAGPATPAAEGAKEPVGASGAAAVARPQNAAVVNGQAIPYAAFEGELRLLQHRLQQQGREFSAEQMAELRGQLVNELINQELLFQESVKNGAKVDAQEVDAELAALKARHQNPGEFAGILAQMQTDENRVKEQIARRMSIRAWLDKEVLPKIRISDDEAKQFYEQHPEYFDQPEQVHARHILVKVDEGAAPAVKAAALKKIEGLQKRIAAGEDFALLAKEHSDCPSSAQGGDLGYFSREKMVKPFGDKAFSLPLNTVSEPVETSFGYHLIEVLDHRQGKTTAFAEAAAKIKNNLHNRGVQEAVQALLVDLRKTAKIRTFIE